MATLNVTPGKGIIESDRQQIQVAEFLDTDCSIDISSDDTATELPKLYGNIDAEYYRVHASAAMKIGLGGSSIGANNCKMYLPTGHVEYIARARATHIIKDDE
jgi:hypothetical protein